MAVYVDDARHPLGRMIMGHMLADTLHELHEMADAIGLRREWFQPLSHPHYDLSRQRRAQAVQLGAIEVDRRGIVMVKRRQSGDPAFMAEVRAHYAAHGYALPRFMANRADDI